MGEYSDNDKEYAEKIVRYYNRMLFFSGLVVLVILIQIVNPNILSFLTSGAKGETSAMLKEEFIDDEDRIENGIHVASGLIVDEGYELVVNTCGSCHSYKLVTQNKGNEEDWKDIILWMQETQKLWDLGPTEEPIVKYLAKNYGPNKKSRRANLTDVVWYELE